MSPTYRPHLRSAFITRVTLITLLLSAFVAVAMFAAVSASGPRYPAKPISLLGSRPQSQRQRNSAPSFKAETLFVNAPLTSCVNPGGTGGCSSTIQTAVSAASSGDTIDIQAGTYTENVTIDKSLTLTGAGAATVTLRPAISNPNCGGAGGGSLCAGASNIILVQADNVTISGLTLDGDNPNIASGTVVGGADLDARNGIITNHLAGTFTNLVVHHMTVKNIFLRGMYASSGGSFNFHDNTVQNVQGNGASIAMFNSGGSGIFNNNIVSDAGDAISSNHSKGVQFTNNLVTTSASGIHTDNSGDGGGIADTISGNTVSNSQINGYGIWVFVPYKTVNVQNNIVTNVDVGFASFGMNAGITTAAVFTGNTVDGQNRPNSTGVYFTTSQIGFGSSNNSVTFTSNTVVNNVDGFLLEAETGFSLAVSAGFNRIVNNTGSGATINGSPGFAGPLTAGMENNWWGCNAGPNNPGCGSVVGGGVDFTPWLVLGIGASPSTIQQGGSSTITADLTRNSDSLVPSGTNFIPPTGVSFAATQGTIIPSTGTLSSGQASSTFTSTSASNGSASTTVDNQTVSTTITVQPLVVTIAPATSPTVADNDYTRINNAIQSSFAGQTINLNGTFNWTEPSAAASWALGSDGVGSTADDYSILVPANRNNVTLTASSLGNATIQGPGDLAAVNLEGVLVFDGGDNQNWTISNIRFLDFDLTIGMFAGAGGTDAFNNTHITNNYIRIARDLNATVAPADVNQNIGIHYAFGINQVISGNTIDIQGDGVSDSAGGKFATDVGMQSNTSGGSVYDDLQITNNTIRVLNAQSGDPENILGIWENAHGHTSNIIVGGNQFINQAAGNNPVTNLQRGFRVTSHSSATTIVSYQNNTVTGANIGFQWISGSNFTGNQPVRLTSNTITNNATGVLVQSNGLANLSFNRIVGNSVAGTNNLSGTVTAENNWWGCNAGPGNTGCNGVIGTVDFNPWIVLAASATPNSILPGGTSSVAADMTHNSDGAVPSGTLPDIPINYSATNGTMTPTSGSVVAGSASSTFTSTNTNSAIATVTVDNQSINLPIAVSAAPSFSIDDVTHNEGNSGTTAYTFTVTKTGSTLLNATVDYATVDGSATSPSDFTAVPTATLTFLPADTTKQFTVFVNGDTTFEPNEAFTVHLSNAGNASISDADGTGTITNDDTDVSVAVSPASVAEDGATNLAYTFTRNGITTGSLTVNFSVGGTATLATDYTQSGAATFSSSSGTVTFGAGSSTATVTIDPSADSTVESNETAILTVTSGSGYNVGSPGAATGTITNDDTDLSVAVSPSSVAEDGATNLVYTFTRNGVTSGALTVNFSVGGAAGFATDYTQTGAATFGSSSGTVVFGAGNFTASVTIDPTPDLAFEPDETVILTATSGTGYSVANPSSATGTITNDDTLGGIIRFSSATYNTTESSGSTTITVERLGDTSQGVTVDYTTPDDSASTTVVPCATITGLASPRCDFTTALGTLRFAAGETSKTFTVLISQDNYVEGPETLPLTLSNPTGGAVFGVPSTATLTIADDATEPPTNPIDDSNNFVRQHYHDFLNREPDAAGLAFWTNNITQCGTDAQCIEFNRINVSAAFYLSIEFQSTGFLVERLYKTSYGDATGTSVRGGAHQLPVPIVKFSEFLKDTQTIGQGVVVGQTGWEIALENNKQAFLTEFVQRLRFTTLYSNTLTPAQFVDMLFANAGVVPTSSERQTAINEFGGSGTSASVSARSRVLRQVSENNTLAQQEFNRAFVLMQYFGYLRRNPDAAPDSDHTGYDFWLDKLIQFNGNYINAEMVKAFLNSGEYRNRFGQ